MPNDKLAPPPGGWRPLGEIFDPPLIAKILILGIWCKSERTVETSQHNWSRSLDIKVQNVSTVADIKIWFFLFTCFHFIYREGVWKGG